MVGFIAYISREKRLPEWVRMLVYTFLVSMPFVLVLEDKFVPQNNKEAAIFCIFCVMMVVAVLGGVSLASKVLEKRKAGKK